MDAALFRGSAYRAWVKPASYSGRIESGVRRVERALGGTARGSKLVVLMGNSATAEGVDESIIDEGFSGAGLPLRSLNLAEGGASPNAWLPILSSIPLDARTTRALVLGLSLSNLGPTPTPRPDVELAKTRISFRDGLGLALAGGSLERRGSLLVGSLFRLPWYADDVRDLLHDPGARRREIARAEAGEQALLDAPRRMAKARSLAGIELDGAGNVSFEHAEPWLRRDPRARDEVEQQARRHARARDEGDLPPPIDPGYLRSLDRLVRRFHARGIAVIWAVLPDSPFATHLRLPPEIDAMTHRLGADGIDVATFHDAPLIAELEQPRYYADVRHLSREGAALYSRALVRFLAPRLGA